MKFNTKTRYGMRTMVEIAKADPKTGIFQKDIAENQKLSIKYLDAIVQSLKTAGLIANVKGKKSGYRITRPAGQISMLHIHKAFEAEIAVIDCLSEHIECEMKEICHTYPFWKKLNSMVEGFFSDVTLRDLMDRKEL